MSSKKMKSLLVQRKIPVSKTVEINIARLTAYDSDVRAATAKRLKPTEYHSQIVQPVIQPSVMFSRPDMPFQGIPMTWLSKMIFYRLDYKATRNLGLTCKTYYEPMMRQIIKDFVVYAKEVLSRKPIAEKIAIILATSKGVTPLDVAWCHWKIDNAKRNYTFDTVRSVFRSIANYGGVEQGMLLNKKREDLRTHRLALIQPRIDRLNQAIDDAGYDFKGICVKFHSKDDAEFHFHLHSLNRFITDASYRLRHELEAQLYEYLALNIDLDWDKLPELFEGLFKKSDMEYWGFTKRQPELKLKRIFVEEPYVSNHPPKKVHKFCTACASGECTLH